ncbi:MAG: HutD/Ves family protein [Pseudolabrys sp.]
MRIVRAADYRRMPWTNGGGSTTEVAIAPATATLDNFDWRISMAHVAAPGPFSRFPGIDRTLAVIEGAGIHLTLAGATVTLDRGAPPHFFPGDIETAATLIDGPIDDLNVMSRRTRYDHRMTRHRAGETVALPQDAETVLLMPRGGSVTVELGAARTTIADGDTALMDQTDLADSSDLMLRQDGGTPADIFVIAFWGR